MTVRILAAVATAAATLLVGGCASQPTMQGDLVIAKQGSFFVGGREVRSDKMSMVPTVTAAGTIVVDQIYVRYQVPPSAKRVPIVMVHGCCLTGKTWETTPDGRMGWDEFFVRKGYGTYVVDQAWRGRSAWNPAAINQVKAGAAAPDTLPTLFAAGQEPAWAIFRFGPEHGKVFPGMKFPLDAQAEFWKQMVPDWFNALPAPNPTVPSLGELARKLGGAVLMSHSQSGIYPFQAAALDTNGIAAIVSIEPSACPAVTSDLTPYTKMPILVLYGDYMEQSSRWAPRLKLCREFIAAANQRGGKAQLVVLPEIGIAGNSHMLMQDTNSLEIAEWLAKWLDGALR